MNTENLTCVDGGVCHHDCLSNAVGVCFRSRCCLPLTGSGFTDNWEIKPEGPDPLEVLNLPVLPTEPKLEGDDEKI